MTEEFKKGPDFRSSGLLQYTMQWKRPLAVVTLLSAIAAAIFSSPVFISPKFESTVIMFPTSNANISQSLLADNPSEKMDLLLFGEEEQAEQLLQILYSDEIRNRICEKYTLMEHYEIDSTENYRQTKLLKEYESNIQFRRTEFQSVRIDVMDTDPQMAADIANDIAALVDSVKNRMQQERAHKAMLIAQDEYFKMRDYVNSLEDSLSVLRSMGINDYESMSERYTEYHAKAILEGNQRAMTKLEEQLGTLSKYGGAYVSIRDILEHEKKQLSHLRVKYHEAKVNAEQTLPHKFIVNNAVPAEKKSYPIRWLIVIVAGIAAFLFTLLAIIAMENLNTIKSQKPIS